jgi:PST family polysaccharide transporter
MALRVITWPMGFIIVARGEQTLFVLTELAWTCVNVGLTWVCVESFGVEGAGIAFFGSYVFHGMMIYPIVRRLSGFRWSSQNRKVGLAFLSIVTMVFAVFYVVPPVVAVAVGAVATIASGWYSMRVLLNLVSSELIPRAVQRFLARIGVTCSTPR